MTCRLGGQFGGIFASGAGTEPGNTLKRHYAPGLGRPEGRNATPNDAIIDSQSVKTTEKGGSGAMMREKRSLVASASHIDSVTIDTVTLNPNGTVTVEGTLTCTDNGQLDVAGLTVVVTQGDNDETIVDAEGTYTCAGGDHSRLVSRLYWGRPPFHQMASS